MQEGDQVIPLRYRLEKPFQATSDYGQWNDPVRVLDAISEEPELAHLQDKFYGLHDEALEIQEWFGDNADWIQSQEAQGFFDEITGIMKDEGYDGIKYPNAVEAKSGLTREAAARKGNIKTQIAAMDQDLHARLDAEKPGTGASYEEFMEWLKRREAAIDEHEATPARVELVEALMSDPRANERFTNESQILFDSNQARSRFANFDPLRLEEGDLLATRPETMGAAGLLATLAGLDKMQSEDTGVY